LKFPTARVDVLVWVLIYGGLLGAALGLAIEREGARFGWGFVVIGATAALGGAVLIWIRSRMSDPADPGAVSPAPPKEVAP
jgi:hypothetical protein